MLLDANMLVPDAHYPPADQNIDRDDPDAATMEEAISLFMDGMDAQEHCGFNDLHGLLGSLPWPVPTVKASQAMTHKDTLEGGFIQCMTEEEQKQFTPSELLLYKHARIQVQTGMKHVLVHTSTCEVHTSMY